MSMTRQAGIILPGYNPLLVANAPTIGTATAGTSNCASVTFTAPACTGGSVITTYTVYANCGAKTATGASSPITVTGLTTGSSYTFKVIATNIYGPSYPSAASNSITAVSAGSQSYTTAGTYSWVAPTGVTSVSIVAVGGGGGGAASWNGGAVGGGGGGGGALVYRNNVSVTPGNSYTVVVGAGGSKGAGNYYSPTGDGGNGANSSVLSAVAGGGTGGKVAKTLGGCVVSPRNGSGGTVSGTYTAGYTGGAGGDTSASPYRFGGGGGGAAGYACNGGAGGIGNSSSAATAGSGGGGGGGQGSVSVAGVLGGGGGGVGLLGQGSNGGVTTTGSYPGGGGSSGSTGINGCSSISFPNPPGGGGSYGGGGGGASNNGCYGACGSVGAGGAVRIIWPGNTRSFPSTCAGNP